MTKSDPNHAPEIGISAATAVLKAAGDELRGQILRILQHDAFGVLELCRIFGLRQPAMSHHLKILSQAGLVTSRREGTCIFYRRAYARDDGLDTLRQQIFTHLDSCPIPAKTALGMAAVHKERAHNSQAFFRDNVDRFREQQDLIASYAQYGDTVVALIDTLNLPAASMALEVGPGEGELLPELVGRFQRVTALDNSAEMLARVQAACEAKSIKGIEFLLDDICNPGTKIRADLITLNMVLHHLARPADTLKVLHGLLVEGGALIITDLCQHDQDWAHDACGDLWLGFCPEELEHWADAAGFSAGSSQFLAQRNGFRIQVRAFMRAA